MKEIFYVVKEFRDRYFMCELYLNTQFCIGANISMNRYLVNLELFILWFEFTLEVGVITEYKD